MKSARIALSSLALAATAFTFGCANQFELGNVPTPLPTRDVHVEPTASEILDHPCENGDVAGCIALCKTNDARSCNFAGTLLEFDPSGRDDPALASGYYRRACNAAFYPGCNNLAWLYLGGRGVKQDKAQAMRLFYYAYDASRLACLDGDVDGCLMAGELVEEGRGVERDDVQAIAFYQRACDGGAERGCERVSAHK